MGVLLGGVGWNSRGDGPSSEESLRAARFDVEEEEADRAELREV